MFLAGIWGLQSLSIWVETPCRWAACSKLVLMPIYVVKQAWCNEIMPPVQCRYIKSINLGKKSVNSVNCLTQIFFKWGYKIIFWDCCKKDHNLNQILLIYFEILIWQSGNSVYRLVFWKVSESLIQTWAKPLLSSCPNYVKTRLKTAP